MPTWYEGPDKGYRLAKGYRPYTGKFYQMPAAVNGVVQIADPPGSPLHWYNASNLDGSNNTTLTDGDSLASVTDLGSASEDLAQATANLQPQYDQIADAGNVGNLPGVYHRDDANNDYLQTATFTEEAFPLFVCALVKLDTVARGAGDDGYMLDGITAAKRASCMLQGQDYYQLFAGTYTYKNPPSGIAAGEWNMLCWAFDGASSEVYINATAVADVVNSPSHTGITGITVGTAYTGAGSMDGHWSQIVIYQTTWPGAAAMQTWVETVAGTLPQGP